MRSTGVDPRRGISFILGALALLIGQTQQHGNAADAPAPPAEYAPTPGEFDSIGQAVLALLQSKDAHPFATNLAISAGDFRSLATTNLSADELAQLQQRETGADHWRSQLETSAGAVLSRAGALHLDFAKGTWQVEVTPPAHTGQVHWTSAGQPMVTKLDLIVKPMGGSNSTAGGDFSLAVHDVDKFPGGWRVRGGLQWTGFPAKVADEKTLRELALLQKVAGNQGFTAEDDPALLTVADTLVRFLRTHDAGVVEKDLLVGSDLIWDMLQKSGRTGPTREEVDGVVKKENERELQMAQGMLKMVDDAGVDLKDAEIKITSASVADSQGSAESLEQTRLRQFKLTLSVKTEAKAKNGQPLAGDYVLGIKRLVRYGEAWKLEDNLHWEKLPDGILDAQTIEKLNYETYVAEHGTLPPKSLAPDIEFTTLAGGQKLKLSDLRGKVVILDFWATWCGPCQEPMAHLQTLRQDHAAWQDRVAIVPLSIDDTIEIVRKHVDQRGWTNTFNVWAGEGGWHAVPPTTFRVTGVPTSYVIDQQGQIVWAGHPATAQFGDLVDQLLAH